MGKSIKNTNLYQVAYSIYSYLNEDEIKHFEFLNFFKILSFDGDITISSYNQKIENYEDLILKLKDFKEIQKTIPVVEKQALITKNDNNIGVIVKGIEESE
jgi:hypothetical protein